MNTEPAKLRIKKSADREKREIQCSRESKEGDMRNTEQERERESGARERERAGEKWKGIYSQGVV